MGFTNEYGFIAVAPNIDDYMRLRKTAGLTEFARDAAVLGLEGTILGAVVTYKDDVVGMGRVVGDGGCFFQVVDIAVDPSHQGRGLGQRIIASLMQQLREKAPSSAYVNLIADVPANNLYKKFGFKETAPKSIAMALFI